MKITFIGTPRFGEIALKRLIDNKVTPSLVVTLPDRKSGRGQKPSPSPVKQIAIDNNIKVEEAKNKNSLHKIIKEESPDIAIVAAFGMIIKEETLDIPIKGFLNIHPSLLPEYRGASPIQSAIIDGVKESGVTIIKIDKEMDHGPIICSAKIPFEKKITYFEAEKALAEKGADILSSALPCFFNKENDITPQDHSLATYTPKIVKEHGKINWSESAEIIERKVRAFNPWPGMFTSSKIGIIKIIEADTQKQTKDGPFGDPGKTYLATNNKIAVQSGKDFLIIEKLQVEGKRPVLSKDFLQGNIEFIGSILG